MMHSPTSIIFYLNGEEILGHFPIEQGIIPSINQVVRLKVPKKGTMSYDDVFATVEDIIYDYAFGVLRIYVKNMEIMPGYIARLKKE